MKKMLLWLCMCLLLIVALPAMADKDDDDDDDDYDVPPGRSFQELQRQIDALRDELRNLKGDIDYEREGKPFRDKVGFTLQPGDTYSLDLPKTHRAVRIEVTLRFKDDDDAIYFPSREDDAPSNIMYAVVYRNPIDSDSDIELSWIGTDSDGTNGAGTFSDDESDETIAEIYGDVSGEMQWLGRLVATDDRRIRVEHNDNLDDSSYEEGRYVVTIW